MTNSLPPHPSLENLKKQAKTLLKAWQAGDPGAQARIQAVHPRYSSVKPRLTDCQLVLAREAGFASWPQLKVTVDAANKDLADEFITLGCLCYDDPHYDHRMFPARAFDLLRQNTWLAEANIWSAATAGDASTVTKLLDKKPDLVNKPGHHGWSPLLCACYSRVKPVDESHSTFAAAKLLLDRGADPNAYTMKGNSDERLDQTPRRFTALTGLFGGGSTGTANQPPHPHWRELAELLLERGANPADDQALNHGQYDSHGSLAMLLRHGLKPDARASGGITLMGRELSKASRLGQVENVRLLLAHNARTDEAFDAKTPWQHAMERGHLDIARTLEDAGAPASALNDVERFESLCMAGDEPGARAMLEQAPDLLARASKDLVQRATGTRRIEAVRLVLDLGFDPNWMEDNAPLHSVAGNGDEEMVRLLVNQGASPTLRDPWYDGTAVEWAAFFEQDRMRDVLLDEFPICLFDALDHNRLDRIPDILARDPAALERPFAECLSRKPNPEDFKTPLVRMVEKGNADAVRALLHHGANADARRPDGRRMVEIAAQEGFREIAELLGQNREG